MSGLVQSQSCAADPGQDGLDGGSPDDGLRFIVVRIDVAHDCVEELRNTAEDAATQAPAGESP